MRHLIHVMHIQRRGDHDERYRDITFDRKPEDVTAALRDDGYQLAAVLDFSGSSEREDRFALLEQAFKDTQHDFHPKAGWAEGRRRRSSMCGDVFIIEQDDELRAYVVAGFGFDDIGLAASPLASILARAHAHAPYRRPITDLSVWRAPEDFFVQAPA